MSKTAKADQTLSETKSDKYIFIMAVLNLTWQMAIVVLVPIIGGLELDKKYNSTPLLTLAGLAVTTLGVAAVLWHQLQLFGPPKTQAKTGPKNASSAKPGRQPS